MKVDATLPEVQEWIGQRMGKELTVESATGNLSNFVVEPFLSHKPEEEFYVRSVGSGFEVTIIILVAHL